MQQRCFGDKLFFKQRLLFPMGGGLGAMEKGVRGQQILCVSCGSISVDGKRENESAISAQ